MPRRWRAPEAVAGTPRYRPPRRQGGPGVQSFCSRSALLAFAGCSQWQTYKCVRDTVSRNEPYYNQADREDSESLAWQACRERAAAKGN